MCPSRFRLAVASVLESLVQVQSITPTLIAGGFTVSGASQCQTLFLVCSRRHSVGLRSVMFLGASRCQTLFLVSSQRHSAKGLPQALTDPQSARDVARLSVEMRHRRAQI